MRTIRTQNAWVRETPAGLGIELHWHLIDAGYYVQRVPIAWFWDHSMEVPLGARRVRVFSPEAQLLHLAAHIELHHAGAGVWWVYDVAALLHKFGGALDWDLIIDAAERFEWGRSLRVAVARADDGRRVRSGGGDRASRGDACHLARARGADFGGTIGPSCRVSVRQLGAGELARAGALSLAVAVPSSGVYARAQSDSQPPRFAVAISVAPGARLVSRSAGVVGRGGADAAGRVSLCDSFDRIRAARVR